MLKHNLFWHSKVLINITSWRNGYFCISAKDSIMNFLIDAVQCKKVYFIKIMLDFSVKHINLSVKNTLVTMFTK